MQFIILYEMDLKCSLWISGVSGRLPMHVLDYRNILMEKAKKNQTKKQTKK